MSKQDLSPGLRVCIVGAGLTGSLMALLLSQLEGVEVHLFEKRIAAAADATASTAFGASTAVLKRSINLALSHRGILALEALEGQEIYSTIMGEAIRMPCRVIHNTNGSTIKQPYGLPSDAIWSISRQKLNQILIDHASRKPNIQVYFGYSLKSCQSDGYVSLLSSKDNKSREEFYDLVIGADGAYSFTRDCMLKQSRVNFSRQYIRHGYKELTIPPNALRDFALKDHQGLHIWPRGEMMLIALPNADKSFTATLFAPFQGRDGFDSVDVRDREAILSYFHRHFPDVVELMPQLLEEYQSNPVGSLVTIRVTPWNLGKVVLIGNAVLVESWHTSECVIVGDAAHAVVPFYGQGMNCGFEDCLLLYDLIRMNLGKDIEHLLADFSSERSVATNTLADLCLEHYHDMAANTRSYMYLLQKRVEGFLHWLLPSTFVPLYSMVAFTHIPYHIAVERAKTQERIIGLLTKISLLAVSLSSVYIFYSRGGAASVYPIERLNTIFHSRMFS